MPPKARVTREMIVEAGFAIAREQGIEQVNARTVLQRRRQGPGGRRSQGVRYRKIARAAIFGRRTAVRLLFLPRNGAAALAFFAKNCYTSKIYRYAYFCDKERRHEQ